MPARVSGAPWAVRLIFSLLGPIRHQRRKQLFRLVRVDGRRLLLDRQTELAGPFLQLSRPDEQEAEMEPDDGRLGKAPGQRAEPTESGHGIALREVRDGRCGENR